VIAAVDLDQLPQAGTTAARLVNALPLRAGHPKLSVDHPAPEGLDRHRDVSSLALIVRYPGSSMSASQHDTVPETRHF
jgi:hypothetical protein